MKYKIYNDLQLAEAVFTAGSISAAAREIGISRQAVHQRLRKYNYPTASILDVIQTINENAARCKRELALQQLKKTQQNQKNIDDIIQKHISSLVKARLNELKDFDEYRNFAVAYFAKISDGSLGALHKRFKDERVLRVAQELREQQERYNA